MVESRKEAYKQLKEAIEKCGRNCFTWAVDIACFYGFDLEKMLLLYHPPQG
jgi:hypothetical protein